MQCKVVVVSKIRRWYVYFAVGVFMTVAMLSGNLQPLVVITQSLSVPPPVFHGNSAQPKVALACNVFWGRSIFRTCLKP